MANQRKRYPSFISNKTAPMVFIFSFLFCKTSLSAPRSVAQKKMMIQEALNAFDQNRCETALKMSQKVITDYPSDRKIPQLTILAGTCALKLNHPQDAKSLLELGLSHKPTREEKSKIRLLLSEAYEKIGNLDLARSSLDTVLKESKDEQTTQLALQKRAELEKSAGKPKASIPFQDAAECSALEKDPQKSCGAPTP